MNVDLERDRMINRLKLSREFEEDYAESLDNQRRLSDETAGWLIDNGMKKSQVARVMGIRRQSLDNRLGIKRDVQDDGT